MVLSRKAGKCLRSEVFGKTFTNQIRRKKKSSLREREKYHSKYNKEYFQYIVFRRKLIQSLYSDMLINFAIDKNEILYQPIKFSKSAKLFTVTKRK